MDRAGGFNSGWGRDTSLRNLPIMVVGPAKPSVKYTLGLCPCWKTDHLPASIAGVKCMWNVAATSDVFIVF